MCVCVCVCVCESSVQILLAEYDLDTSIINLCITAIFPLQNNLHVILKQSLDGVLFKQQRFFRCEFLSSDRTDDIF